VLDLDIISSPFLFKCRHSNVALPLPFLFPLWSRQVETSVLADLKWLWSLDSLKCGTRDRHAHLPTSHSMRPLRVHFTHPQYNCSGKAMLQNQCNRRFLIRGVCSFYGRLPFTPHPHNTLYIITGFLPSTLSLLWWQTWLIGRYFQTHASISVCSSTDKTLLRKLGQSQMDIMLDGYIAQTLTPFFTEKYLRIFMSCLDKQLGSLFVFNNQWIVARPTITQLQKQRRATTGTRPKPGSCTNARAKTRASLPPDVPPTAARTPMSPLVNNEYAADTVYEIFDRKVDLRMGTIVPQPSAIGVSKKTGVLSPVFFIQRDGTLGIPYEYPFPKRCTLHNATALAPTILKRGNQNVRIRLQVSTPPPGPSHPRALGKSWCMYSVVNVFFFSLFPCFSCSGPGINSSNTSLGYRIGGSKNKYL